jgi:hypothetical protein
MWTSTNIDVDANNTPIAHKFGLRTKTNEAAGNLMALQESAQAEQKTSRQ